MNRSYRLLWNDLTQRYVPVPETARGRSGGCPGKCQGRAAPVPMALLLGALLALPAAAQPLAPLALPAGAKVAARQASISTAGNQMTIHQKTPKAILQWDSFDIGRDASVHFQQTHPKSIALNRVTGNKASQIDGKLTADHQVWLVNPNGVVFGKDSQVKVGGLIASTLDITDKDFKADKAIFTRGAAQGGITNQGNITVADGGMLALLAPKVKNEGMLRARLGHVVLAGGDRVALDAGADGGLVLSVDPATVSTLIENQQLIEADGGMVLMTADAADALSGSVVSNMGTVQARTLAQNQGRILLLGGSKHGKVVHGNRLDEDSQAVHAGLLDAGGGGHVETSAAEVSIAPGAKVNTAATQEKETGNWLIRQENDRDLHISPVWEDSGIGANMLQANLAATNITLETGCSIGVSGSIAYDRNRLVLNAGRDIVISRPLAVGGTGTLELNYGGTAGKSGVSPRYGAGLHVERPVSFAHKGPHLLKVNGERHTVISSLEDLQGIGMNRPLDGKYALGGSIDAQGADFEPIGATPQAPFKGTLDGLGHTIRNLNINRPGEEAAGLVRHAGNATLRNIKLEQASVKGNVDAGAPADPPAVHGATATVPMVPTLAAQAPPLPAHALPAGGRVLFGSATSQQDTSRMVINQSSPKVILQWQGFDIGSAASVHFNQPGADAIALNRVLQGNPSRIDGRLSGNGQVFLVNPNGVVFGQGGQVNTGALVASTLDISDQDFHSGRAVFTRGAAQGSIRNSGMIVVNKDQGGLAALLAPQVLNEGAIGGPRSKVVLAGGDKVTLQVGADGQMAADVDPGTVGTRIENSGMITADGGQVLMMASAAGQLAPGVVSNTGTVQAQTLGDRTGSIWLLADMQRGQVVQGGLLDASAAGEGNGGLVRTRAATVHIAPDARVDTCAVQGKTGNWSITQATDLSIDPIWFDGGRGIGANMLRANLASTDITLDSGGDIWVNANIRYDRNHLALNAHKSIHVRRPASVEGEGTLELNYGGTAGNAAVHPADGSNLHINRPVDFAKTGDGLLKVNGDRHTVIGNILDLQDIGVGRPPNGSFALGRSFDAQGFDFKPICATDTPFTGSFDGLGHAIQNLTIDRPDKEPAALFAYARNATLRNIHLEQVRVKGDTPVGALVALHVAMDGKFTPSGQVTSKTEGKAGISNVHVTGEVSGKNEVGGLVGRNSAEHRSTASISHASFDGKVSGESSVGGLVGVNESNSFDSKASIGNASFTGEVIGTSNATLLNNHNLAHFSRNLTISRGQPSRKTTPNLEIGALVGRHTALDGGTSAISDVSSEGSIKGLRAGSGLGLLGSIESYAGVASLSNATAQLPNRPRVRIEDISLEPGRIFNMTTGGMVKTNESAALQGSASLAAVGPAPRAVDLPVVGAPRISRGSEATGSTAHALAEPSSLSGTSMQATGAGAAPRAGLPPLPDSFMYD